jgi:hypothetical protein
MKATMFLRRPVPLIAPHPKIGLGSVRQKDLPCGFEIGAGLVEGGCRAAMVFAGGRARIEAAVSLPWTGIVRVAGADRNRADMHVAENRCASILRWHRENRGG